MFSPTRTALFIAIGAISLAANEANAGCRTLASGAQLCASWIPGSVICNATASGFPPGDGAEGQCWVEDFPNNPTPGVLTGTAFCGPPLSTSQADCKRKRGDEDDSDKSDHEGDSDKTGHKVDCQRIRNAQVPASDYPFPGEQFVDGTFNRRGVFRWTLEINPDTAGLPDPFICSDVINFPIFLGFTPNKFNGVSRIRDLTNGDVQGITLTQTCTRNGNSYNCVPLPTD